MAHGAFRLHTHARTSNMDYVIYDMSATLYIYIHIIFLKRNIKFVICKSNWISITDFMLFTYHVFKTFLGPSEGWEGEGCNK